MNNPEQTPLTATPDTSAEELLKQFRTHMRAVDELYAVVCREFGVDPDDDTDHRANADFGREYYSRRDDLYADAAQTAESLFDLIESGGPLPAAFTQTPRQHTE